MFKERFKLVGLKISTFVTEPWKISDAISGEDGPSQSDTPKVIWLMYFCSYICLIAIGLNFYTVLTALIFSFIIMKMDFRKNFYFVNYKTRKTLDDKFRTDTGKSE